MKLATRGQHAGDGGGERLEEFFGIATLVVYFIKHGKGNNFADALRRKLVNHIPELRELPVTRAKCGREPLGLGTRQAGDVSGDFAPAVVLDLVVAHLIVPEEWVSEAQ